VKKISAGSHNELIIEPGYYSASGQEKKDEFTLCNVKQRSKQASPHWLQLQKRLRAGTVSASRYFQRKSHSRP
jgi:hypothetical protein